MKNNPIRDPNKKAKMLSCLESPVIREKPIPKNSERVKK